MSLALVLLAAALHPFAGAEAVVVGVLCGLWAFRVATGAGLPFPRSRWQVPAHWRESLPLLFTLTAYGYLLGLGCLTDVVLPTFWVFVGLSVLDATVVHVVGAWLVYAATRAWRTNRGVRAAPTCPVPSTGAATPFGKQRLQAVVFLATTSAALLLSTPT
jgi:hypothetical protein